MSSLNRIVQGNFDTVVKEVENGIMNSSLSASFEDDYNTMVGGKQVALRIFERYTMMGGNRLTMSVLFTERGNDSVEIYAVTSGGGGGLVKIINWGEDSFLGTLERVLNDLY